MELGNEGEIGSTFTDNVHLIKDNMIPDGTRGYYNAPTPVKWTVKVALTISEFGFARTLPTYLAIPYDINSGANFITIPTSRAGVVSNLLNTPLH